MSIKLKHTLAALGISLAAQAAIAEEVVNLRMSIWQPPKSFLNSQILPAWADEIEVASNGTLKIKIDPAPIASPAAQYDVVRDGAADMSNHAAAYTPGLFEELRGIELPFISPSAEIGGAALYDWYERNIGFDNVYKDTKVLTVMITGPGVLYSVDDVTTLEQVQDMKIRAGGGGVRIAEYLGATPVTVPATKAYETIQSGVASGVFFPLESVKSFRLADVVDYALEVPGGLYTNLFIIAMNKDRWDGLSDEHKAILTEFGGSKGAAILGAGWDRADVEGRKLAEDSGMTIRTISDEELKKWQAALDPMNSDWVKQADEAGYDGAALLEDLRATIAKYSNM